MVSTEVHLHCTFSDTCIGVVDTSHIETIQHRLQQLLSRIVAPHYDVVVGVYLRNVRFACVYM